MSSSVRFGRLRKFKSRIVARIAFSTDLLTAGVNPQKIFCEYGPRTDLGRKQYPRKSNITVSLFLASIVLAVDNPRPRRMQFQTALRQPSLERFANALRLQLTLAVYQPVVRIPAPPEFRERSCHPEIKCIVA